MTTQTFEDRLGAAFESWADEATVEVDSMILAAALPSSRGWSWRVKHVMPRFGVARLALALLLLAALLSALVVGSTLVHQSRTYDGRFVPQPDMSALRDHAILLTLRDGNVLMAGGDSLADPTSVQIFDPVTSTYQEVVGDIPTGGGSAIQLTDGRVLLVSLRRQDALGSPVFLVDPSLRATRQILSEQQAVRLWGAGATPGLAMLPNGQVLMTGSNDVNGRALLFDPQTETFAETATVSKPRIDHATFALRDGRILIAGGSAALYVAAPTYGSDGDFDDVEIYDPATGLFSAAGTMPTVRGPTWAAATADGRVLLVHVGDTSTAFGEEPAHPVAMDLFDPTTGTFSALDGQRWFGPPTMTAIPNGSVLLTGMSLAVAVEGGLPNGSAWGAVFDPIAVTTTTVHAPRELFPQGVVLNDGQLLLAGGFANDSQLIRDGPVSWVEIFR